MMIATLILAATAAAPQTPEAAALLFLQPSVSHTHPTVSITSATARLAVVRFTGAVIESAPCNGYLLAQKFSFGWQPIALNIGDKPILVPKTAGNQRDVGPPADVEAIRAKAAGSPEIIPFVRVIDGYAILDWWGWGGGEIFYKKTPQGWKRLAGGGGAYISQELHDHYGVPLATAKALLKQ